MMAKVVYNACYGGFGLSPEATLWLWERGCKGVEATHIDEYWPKKDRPTDGLIGYEANLSRWRDYLKNGPGEKQHLFLSVFTPDEQYVLNAREIDRTDPLLIQVVEEMGEGANGSCADLNIAEIPSGSRYRIDEYDGSESVMTPEDYEWQVAP